MKKTLLLGIFSMFAIAESNGLKISSLDFDNGTTIPQKFTARHDNKPPRLTWSGMPAKTQTLVLICQDPDAPQPQPWVHWVVYNIPSQKADLDFIKDQQRQSEFTNGTMQGINSDNNIGYDGPNPPSGKVHHYHFTLYALDKKLSLKPGATKEAVMSAMKGHILAQAQTVGLYKQ